MPDRKLSGATLVAPAALLLPAVSLAATLTGTLPVSASVVATCRNLVVATLSHSIYDPGSASDNDAQSSINIQCTNSTPLVISASGGTGSIVQRQLASGGERLNYNLYTNSARTTIWGDGISGSSTIAAIGAGTANSVAVTIYSRIPKGQANAAPGAYSDALTVTVSY